MENSRFLLFSLDDGGELRGLAYACGLGSAGVPSRQESYLEMHENGLVWEALDDGGVVWRTSVRFEKKRCLKALSKPRLRAVL